jgi:hypothetical protein
LFLLHVILQFYKKLMQNNLVFFYLIRRNKMVGPSRTFRHASSASGVTDTARKVQATKGRNTFEQARQAEYEASKSCSQARTQAEPVVKQTAKVYKVVVEHTLPQKEMVHLAKSLAPEPVPAAEEYLQNALRKWPAMAWYLQKELSLNLLLLPMENPLKQQVADLWEKILQHRQDAKRTNRPIGTFFGPNQYALWQAIEFASKRKLSEKQKTTMKEDGIIEDGIIEENCNTQEEDEQEEDEFF